jgi:nicotinamidase-related amidase
MSLTALDPRTALIVVDLQKGIAAYPTVMPVGDIATRASALIEAFRRHHLPVVLVNVTGGAPGRTEQARRGGAMHADDFAHFVPELQQQPGDHVVTKQTWGAFTRTDLDAYLRGQGVTQVVVLGVATSIGVESTARQAHELGYHVTLAIDAMTDMNKASHDHSITTIFPRLGETGTTQDVIDLLDRTRG